MFQRVTTELIGDLSFVKVYIDDVVMGSKKMKEHVVHMSVVCKQFRWVELKVKLRKCSLAVQQVEIFGHTV